MKYIAVDIGASSGRLIYSILKDGKLLQEEIYRFPNGAKTDAHGRLCWDVPGLYAHIIEGLKIAKAKDRVPDYLGIDTWGVDYCLLDKKGNLDPFAYSYRDKRTIASAAEAHKRIPLDKLYASTGIQFQPFNTVYQLYDDLRSGRLDDASGFLMIPDALGYMLSGIKNQEYTNATTTGLINASTHEWDKQIIDALGLPPSIFDKPNLPCRVLGPIKEEVAKEIGYSFDLVSVSSHDTASAVMAAPILDGSPYISSGTWSLLGIESDTPHLDRESLHFNYSNEGTYERKFRFQKNIMGLWIIQEVRRELGGKHSFAELAKLAEENPTDKVFDANDPGLLSPKSMIEEIEKHTGKLPLGELCHAIFHSLALSYKKAIEELSSLSGRSFNKLHIIGGGGNNKLLNRLTEKETGLHVEVGPIEATSLGNILSQMIASGEIKDLVEGRKIIARSIKED